MPVDLTSDNQVSRMRDAATTLRAERDRLREQVELVPTLYDELAARDEKIARLESRGIEDLHDANDVYRTALEKIVASGGRGGKKIAEDALAAS